MPLERLIARIRAASALHSYRTIGKWCEVSYETIRRLVLSKNPNISIETMERIEKGLAANGF